MSNSFLPDVVASFCSRAFTAKAAMLCACLVAASASFSAEVSTVCKPIEVMATSNRVHVRCEKPFESIIFFAASTTSDPRFANRIIAIAASAQVSQKTVVIYFDQANITSGPSFGCGAANCRPINSIAISEAPAP